ncbi:MAG: PQQ-dependent sugar dehydrogenase [Chloroflexota bacterium]
MADANQQTTAEFFLPTIFRAPSLVITPVGDGFSQVTAITHAGDDRLFIGQRTGEIYVLYPDGRKELFLDLSDRVYPNGSEYGFYSIAFHPDYAGNGFLFVTYTGKVDGKVYLTLGRFHAVTDNSADPASEAVLLRVRQDTDLHKAGGLDFDSRTHQLYMGIGDDTQIALAQDPTSVQGKVIRLDVDDVPPDLVGNAEGRAHQEVWAMGLRNPWRVDVDEPTRSGLRR